MDYALKLETYEGPLEKLLELIEERKLPISEISLAAVTDDFLRYLEQLPAVAPALLADFLTVASRLVLIKSKSLLPELPLTEEEERDIKDLEQRLELYRRLKFAEKHISKMWRSGDRAASRPYLFHAAALPPVFHPGNDVNVDTLATAFRRVYSALEKLVMETETITDVIVSLEDKMKEIVSRMAALGTSSLHGLSGSRAKSEIVVIFLAILHLAREGSISLNQGEQFSDIIVSKISDG